MQPYDYRSMVKSPFESALEGVKFGASLAELQAVRQQREALAQQQKQQLEQQRLQAEQFNQARTAFFNNPNPTIRDASTFLSFLSKDQQAAFEPYVKQISEAENKASLNFGLQVMSALERKPDYAAELLEKRAEAEQNPQNAQFYRQLAQRTRENPADAMKVGTLLLAPIPGAKEALDNMAAGAEEARKKELHPLIVEETKRKGVPTSIQESIDYEKLTPQQQKTFQSLQVLKKPPAAVTNVNVTNLEKSASGELAKLLPDLYEQANSASAQLNDLPNYRAALSKAITGPLAEQRLTLARISSAFGFSGESGIAATRQVIQGLSEMALKSRSLLTGQGSITENEQKLLIQARSGDISFTKPELETIFDVAERSAKAQREKSIKLLKSAASKSETAQMFLDNISDVSQTPAAPPTLKTFSESAEGVSRSGRPMVVRNGVWVYK